ncbi:MAG: branched-chain amino acid ABC transporter ATP-binding protein [Pseudomonadota bacterium]
MLATARALCTNPKVLLLDEPSEGLQPSMIAQIRAVIEQMRAENMGVLLVEQRQETVLAIADRIVVLETGRVVHEADIATLRAAPETLARHLGV